MLYKERDSEVVPNAFQRLIDKYVKTKLNFNSSWKLVNNSTNKTNNYLSGLHFKSLNKNNKSSWWGGEGVNSGAPEG